MGKPDIFNRISINKDSSHKKESEVCLKNVASLSLGWDSQHISIIVFKIKNICLLKLYFGNQDSLMSLFLSYCTLQKSQQIYCKT